MPYPAASGQRRASALQPWEAAVLQFREELARGTIVRVALGLVRTLTFDAGRIQSAFDSHTQERE